MNRWIPALMTSASLLALSTAPRHAQEVFDLGEVTVFSNQAPTAVERTGATVDILDQQELREIGTPKLAERLDILPGVSTPSNGGFTALGAIPRQDFTWAVQGLHFGQIGVPVDPSCIPVRRPRFDLRLLHGRVILVV